MFRSRRSGLVRRLWRQRCTAPGPEDGLGALKPAAHALFKKLKDEELELLVQAVESRGARASGCVWVPRAEPRGAKPALPPHVLLCRLYRWPDLRHAYELKRLSCCQSFWGCGDGPVLCCNPHHLSRLAMPGELGPPGARHQAPASFWPSVCSCPFLHPSPPRPITPPSLHLPVCPSTCPSFWLPIRRALPPSAGPAVGSGWAGVGD
uniref:MH1 domain-containing protein n=1 Tax=Crocodylus porosus TaxID=8502 RepID=A0A7M4F8A2_CROPO